VFYIFVCGRKYSSMQGCALLPMLGYIAFRGCFDVFVLSSVIDLVSVSQYQFERNVTQRQTVLFFVI
jgi:hypothetical protein